MFVDKSTWKSTKKYSPVSKVLSVSPYNTHAKMLPQCDIKLPTEPTTKTLQRKGT